MIATAKEKDGFIDQKTFKTAGKYGFDSLILTDTNMQVLNGYIHHQEPATPILSLCHGIFTDRSIFSFFFPAK